MSCLSLSMKMNKPALAKAINANRLSECFVSWSSKGAREDLLEVLRSSKLVGCPRQCSYPVKPWESLIKSH